MQYVRLTIKQAKSYISIEHIEGHPTKLDCDLPKNIKYFETNNELLHGIRSRYHLNPPINSALSHTLAKKQERDETERGREMGDGIDFFGARAEQETNTQIAEPLHRALTKQHEIPQISNPHGLTPFCPRTHTTPLLYDEAEEDDEG